MRPLLGITATIACAVALAAPLAGCGGSSKPTGSSAISPGLSSPATPQPESGLVHPVGEPEAETKGKQAQQAQEEAQKEAAETKKQEAEEKALSGEGP
jgi:hypothetical protein